MNNKFNLNIIGIFTCEHHPCPIRVFNFNRDIKKNEKKKKHENENDHFMQSKIQFTDKKKKKVYTQRNFSKCIIPFTCIVCV